jgi:hypothetical protein
VSYGPLAFVSGLTLGDYLLWNWSLNYNHDVLALVSGLTLPPLALTFLAMLAMTILRLIGSSTRRSAPGAAVERPGAEREGDPAGDVPAPTTTVAGGGRTAAPAASGSSRSSSGKLAA